MCFPCRFLFHRIFFLPFFYFPVSFCIYSKKMTEKNCFLPTLRYEVFIYARVIALLCERIICVLFALSRFHTTQYDLNHSIVQTYFIFSGQERSGSLFLVTFLFLHRNKKVNSPIRSQHSLDIFHISRSGAKRVFVFGVTYLFLHRNKKVTWTIRYKLIG